ncbi:hypothetical protein [Streptacidiphilus monticola]|jgi:hypothetical protein|uniref:DUF317 domain-containing protein n=1 Tax=Streptacidiphilus monticola TaxID=2161674 RepID=A0ABW1GB03_9ACTN
MAWASWTTVGIFAGPGGVRTEEIGIISGEVSVHTTWADGQAEFAVQYSGSSDWFTLYGSPVACPGEEESRELHQLVVDAVRAGGGATAPGAGPIVPAA